MTPEEQATQWAVRVRHGDPAWVRDIVPQLASIIREAVTEERERCATLLDALAAERTAVALRGDEGASYEADWTRSCAAKIRG